MAVDTSAGINIGLLVVIILSTLLLAIRIVVYPYNMLFGNVTIPVILCCLGAQWNGTLLQLIGALMVLVSFNTCSLFDRITLFDRALRWLTGLLFLLDLLAPSISLLFFAILNCSVIVMLISFPEPEVQIDSF
jgi:hypothetical protein